VGINLAIQDAVAAANILWEPLRGSGVIAEELLTRVQERRTFPTRATQRMQVFAHENVIRPALANDSPVSAPLPVRLFKALPFLQRIPARVVGMGFRPEHIRSPRR
jgi:2-polyprenyl-6-methoxyphenol hydroxylase-like FAD-dependent oxidoreductase